MMQAKSSYWILGLVCWLSFLLFLGTLSQLQSDCRLKAMEKQYPAIEIQGICK